MAADQMNKERREQIRNGTFDWSTIDNIVMLNLKSKVPVPYWSNTLTSKGAGTFSDYMIFPLGNSCQPDGSWVPPFSSLFQTLFSFHLPIIGRGVW
ncbi:hypothetical protein ACGTN9_13015 [Halobacillus sp. MO56]